MSVSAASAATDDSTIQASDEIAIDDNALSAEDEGVTSANDENAVEADDAQPASQVTYVVTKDNFYDCFDDFGNYSVIADEVIFEGDFNEVGVTQILIDSQNPVKFTGRNATFHNVQFAIMQSDVTIDGLNMLTDDTNPHNRLIWIGSDRVISNIVLSNNNITFIGPANDEAYAIFAGADTTMGFYGVSGLQIIKNNFVYTGDSNSKDVINNVIRVNGDEDHDEASDNITVEGNTFDVRLPSIMVDYGYFGDPHFAAEAIVFYYCDDVKFIDNRIDLRYTKTVSSSDTINVVSAYADSFSGYENSNIIIKGNEIKSLGHFYTYGVYISANGFEVSDNKFNMTSDIYHVNAINVQGPSTNGLVANNIMNLQVPTSTDSKYVGPALYGIYAAQERSAIRGVTYDNNTINAEGYYAVGMEIMHPDPIISNNTVTSTGNYTYGIVGSFKPLSAGLVASIENNKIYCYGTNIGEAITSDPLIPHNSMAITVLGNCLVFDNEITSTDIGFNAVEDGTIVLKDNTIDVAANSGKIDNHAIVANDIPSLTIDHNTINYSGLVDYQFEFDHIDSSQGWDNYIYDTSKNARAYGVLVNNSNVVIKNNRLNIILPAFTNDWSYGRKSFSEGVVLAGCDDLVFEDNDLLLTVIGGAQWDSCYALDVLKSANARVINNTITVDGMNTVYGIIIEDNNFTISENIISVDSDNNYACGIDVEGTASGVISGNTITLESASSAYPIYSGMNYMPVDVNITDNYIYAESYYVVGMELGGNTVLVENNEVDVSGNYTIGIGSTVIDLTVKSNNITSIASNVGNEYIGDYMGGDTTGIKLISGSANIVDNTVVSDAIGIATVGATSTATIKDNTIDVDANSGKKDNHAILADNVNDLTIEHNTIYYSGLVDYQFEFDHIDSSQGWDNYIYDTSKNARAYGVLVNNSNVVIKKNYFDIELPAFPNDWSYGRKSFSEGVVLTGCDDLVFEDNILLLAVDGGDQWDSCYALDVLKSANARVVNNTITLDGMNTIYGIIIEDNNFTISENSLSVYSDNNYACGIDVEGTASGVISGNTITLGSANSAYPIYSGMNFMPVDVNITDNYIYADSYYAVGMELGGNNALVENNKIDVTGNHTIGIAADITNLTANNNNITSMATNVGDKPVGDYMGANATGIKSLRGNATISGNDVQTTGDYAVDLGAADATVKNNYLAGNKGVGNGAVVGTGDISVSGGSPSLKLILLGSDLTKTWGSADKYVIKVIDENGDPVVNKNITIDLNGDSVTKATNDKGIVEFDVDLTKGKYEVIATFEGDKVYGLKVTKNTITVNPKATVLKAPSSTVLLTAIKKGYTYQITLKDNSGKALANTKVAVTINNGKVKYYTSDKNGVIKFKLSASKIGTQKIVVKFAGNNKYAASSATGTIKIVKEATKLTTSKTTFKAKVKAKKVKVTLKDSKGKAIKKAKITIKVKGKTYKGTTNAKGVATVKITKLNKKGTFKAKVAYAGNNLYKGITKTIKIKVKK